MKLSGKMSYHLLPKWQQFGSSCYRAHGPCDCRILLILLVAILLGSNQIQWHLRCH